MRNTSLAIVVAVGFVLLAVSPAQAVLGDLGDLVDIISTKGAPVATASSVCNAALLESHASASGKATGTSSRSASASASVQIGLSSGERGSTAGTTTSKSATASGLGTASASASASAKSGSESASASDSCTDTPGADVDMALPPIGCTAIGGLGVTVAFDGTIHRAADGALWFVGTQDRAGVRAPFAAALADGLIFEADMTSALAPATTDLGLVVRAAFTTQPVEDGTLSSCVSEHP